MQRWSRSPDQQRTQQNKTPHLDNLEQLGDMADQTEELHDNASSFAALATQARKKQEATMSGKVGKLFGI